MVEVAKPLMKSLNKSFQLMILSGIIFSAGLIGFCVLKTKHYSEAFSKIKPGESKAEVVALMSEPASTEYFYHEQLDVNNKVINFCYETVVYEVPFQKWTIDFDRNGNVTEKYNWFLGEYGQRPPNSK